MFGFRRKQNEQDELHARAMEMLESQSQAIQDLSTLNKRLSDDLKQAHADRIKFGEDLLEAQREVLSMKEGVIAGARRAIEILRAKEDKLGAEEKKENDALLKAITEILNSVSGDESRSK